VVCEMESSSIGGDTRCRTGGGLDGKRSSKNVENYSPKFYDLKIYGKTQCVKKVHVHRRHETTQNLSLNVACRFLTFVVTDS
ncbi:hypothetical protein ALC56_06696, partial [Trachymyrmex septentrionalis]